MCGIVGYCGHRQAERVIIDGLRRLEYRGYDSAGLAVVADGNLYRAKKSGKLTPVSYTHLTLPTTPYV